MVVNSLTSASASRARAFSSPIGMALSGIALVIFAHGASAQRVCEASDHGMRARVA